MSDSEFVLSILKNFLARLRPTENPVEFVLLGLPIMLSFREFCSKSLTTYVAWRVHLGTHSRWVLIGYEHSRAIYSQSKSPPKTRTMLIPLRLKCTSWPHVSSSLECVEITSVCMRLFLDYFTIFEELFLHEGIGLAVWNFLCGLSGYLSGCT